MGKKALRFLGPMLLMFILSSSPMLAKEPLQGVCPATMPAGTACLTTAELVELRKGQENVEKQVADLKLQLAEVTFEWRKAKLRGRKFGGVVGCGGVVYFQSDSSEVDIDLAPACGVLYGWRF